MIKVLIHHAESCTFQGLAHLQVYHLHREAQQHTMDSFVPSRPQEPRLGPHPLCTHIKHCPSALAPWPEGPFPKPLELQLPSRLLDTQQPPFRYFRCSFTPNQTLAIPSNACRTGNVTPWGLLSLHGAQPAPSSCPASNKLLCTCSYSSSNSPGCVRDTN